MAPSACCALAPATCALVVPAAAGPSGEAPQPKSRPAVVAPIDPMIRRRFMTPDGAPVVPSTTACVRCPPARRVHRAGHDLIERAGPFRRACCQPGIRLQPSDDACGELHDILRNSLGTRARGDVRRRTALRGPLRAGRELPPRGRRRDLRFAIALHGGHARRRHPRCRVLPMPQGNRGGRPGGLHPRREERGVRPSLSEPERIPLLP